MKILKVCIGLQISGLLAGACGGSSSSGGDTGGVNSGGASANSGGASARGGTSSATGGSTARGGATSSAGGSANASGGASVASGGDSAAAGDSAVGGDTAAGGDGSTSGGASTQSGGASSQSGGAAAQGGRAASGGAAAQGGAQQAGGTAGAAGANNCPSAAPTDGAACTTRAACTYAATDQRCTCGGAGANLTWTCAATIMCPATAPATNATCTSVAGGQANNRCAYGTTNCTCANAGGAGGGQVWTCLTPITCPTAEPAAASTCTSVPGGNQYNQCAFGADTCTCQNVGGAGAGQAWNCVGPIKCPAAAPATGDMCTAVAGGAANNACTYNDTTCTCRAAGGATMATWNCVTPLACPATAPTDGAACMLAGGGVVNNTCSYGTARCVCTATAGGGAGAATWACN
jgi:hypothetical protein